MRWALGALPTQTIMEFCDHEGLNLEVIRPDCQPSSCSQELQSAGTLQYVDMRLIYLPMSLFPNSLKSSLHPKMFMSISFDFS